MRGNVAVGENGLAALVGRAAGGEYKSAGGETDANRGWLSTLGDLR